MCIRDRAYADDSSYYLLCALEVIDEDGKLERKADMFTKRTIKPHQAVATVDTASEALAVSISEKACVNMSYMSRLTGKTKEALAGELQGVIFRVPGQLEQDGTPHYVTADEYLSGNVRRKLRQAQRAAQQDPSFAVNVEALTAAQPKDLDVYKRQGMGEKPSVPRKGHGASGTSAGTRTGISIPEQRLLCYLSGEP